jgi:hypothetical protein
MILLCHNSSKAQKISEPFKFETATTKSFHFMTVLLFLPLALGSCTTQFKGTRIATADEHCLLFSGIVIAVRSYLQADGGSVGGGAIHLSSEESRVQIADSSFLGCSVSSDDAAQVHGGACWLFSGRVNFTRTCASLCSSGGYGHFVSLAGRTGMRQFTLTTVLECSPNRAAATRGRHSGAVHGYSNIDVHFNNANFTGCSTRNDGAGVFVEATKASFAARYCEFLKCEAATSIVWANCEQPPIVELSNIVANTIVSVGAALYGHQTGMTVAECVFKRNSKNQDVYRAGNGGNFRLSLCSFDGPLPDREYCDFVEENREFANETPRANRKVDGGRCQNQKANHLREPVLDGQPGHHLSFNARSGSFQSATPAAEGNFATAGIVVGGISSFLSIVLFLYVLCRSRASEKHSEGAIVNGSTMEESPVNAAL